MHEKVVKQKMPYIELQTFNTGISNEWSTQREHTIVSLFVFELKWCFCLLRLLIQGSMVDHQPHRYKMILSVSQLSLSSLYKQTGIDFCLFVYKNKRLYLGQ